MRKCELCNSIARMFCESDQASLCWDCDSKVHSANFLVAKHSRTLLCQSCQSLTPWTGSGPKLGPTLSVCESCVRGNSSHSNRRQEEEDEEEEEEEGSNNDSDEDDGENQVVPLSSSSLAPPQITSSSSSEESSSRLFNDAAQSSRQSRFSVSWGRNR